MINSSTHVCDACVGLTRSPLICLGLPPKRQQRQKKHVELATENRPTFVNCSSRVCRPLSTLRTCVCVLSSLGRSISTSEACDLQPCILRVLNCIPARQQQKCFHHCGPDTSFTQHRTWSAVQESAELALARLKSSVDLRIHIEWPISCCPHFSC